MLYKNYRDLVNKKIAWLIPIKNIRDGFRNILDDIINTMYKVEYLTDKSNLIENKNKRVFIMWSCDGFAGQLWRYILGEAIKQNYNDVTVKYDISWHINGKDAYNKEKRIFDLANCFPDLNIEIASKDEIEIYRRLFTFRCDNDVSVSYFTEILNTRKNLYIDWYPPMLKCDMDIIKEKLDLDKHLFHRLKDKNLDIYKKIIETDASVTIHIRRGDVKLHGGYAVFNNDDNLYKKYLFKSIDKMMIKLKDKKPKFFFISNDMNWVRNNIINKLNISIDYEEVTGNEDQVYFDLYLLSLGKNMILTIGGFSDFGAFFNKSPNPIIITPHNIDSI